MVRWHAVASGLSLICVVLGYAGAGIWAPILGAILGGVVVLPQAWDSIRDRSLDINLLMFIAAGLAAYLQLWQEAAVLLFLFALSSTLEEFALGRTRAAVDALAALRPDEAILLEDGEERKVAVEQIKPGDMVRVLPYSHVPVDGEVVRGASSVNEAAMTGESVPASKGTGDLVLAGTQNLEGALVVRCTAASGDSRLNKVVEALREAQERKSQSERISAWFGSRYTIAVLVFFFVSLGVRMLLGQPFHHALFLSLAGFVALSPCALVLASPAASLSALAFAARRGILVRGGAVFEQAGSIDAALFDKTGTLTSGRLKLTGLRVGETEWHGDAPLSDECRAALAAAAALESQCVHPVADAVVRAAQALDVRPAQAENVEVLPGQGVRGTIDGVAAEIGQAPKGDDVASCLCEAGGVRSTARLEWAGGTAWLCLSDDPRPEASEVMQELRELGIKDFAVLSGDMVEPVSAAAQAAGITEFYGGLSPIDKEQFVGQWVAEGKAVMMVGDGVNDAPSLARARLGVAMGDLGSDIAMGSADAVLATGRLTGLPLLIRLGRKTQRVIRQSLAFAAVVAGTALILSLTADSWPAELQRQVLPLAVVMHEGSTVLAILNGLRLLRGP